MRGALAFTLKRCPCGASLVSLPRGGLDLSQWQRHLHNSWFDYQRKRDVSIAVNRRFMSACAAEQGESQSNDYRPALPIRGYRSAPSQLDLTWGHLFTRLFIFHSYYALASTYLPNNSFDRVIRV